MATQLIKKLLKERANRITLLMLATTLSAWLIALVPELFLSNESAQPEPATLQQANINLNAMIDFLGAVMIFMFAGIFAGIVLFCFAKLPPIKKPEEPSGKACPWQTKHIALSAALFLFVQTIGAATVSWLWFFKLPIPASVVNFAPLALSILGQTAAVCCLIVLTKQHSKTNLVKLLGLKPKIKKLLLAPMLYWPFVPIITLLALLGAALTSLFGLTPQAHPLTDILMNQKLTAGPSTAVMCLAALMAPIFEELFFRGAVFSKLRARAGFFPAAVCTAAFFSICHFNLVQLLPIFALGMLLAYTYEATGSILVPICLHALNNMVSLTAVFALSRIYS